MSAPPRLAAERLGVALRGRTILADVSLALPGGAFVGVIGPNGAGKSTLVRALLGLVPAATGRVLLEGRPLPGIRRAEIARRMAYLAQGQTLHWPLSVERVVALGRLPHLAPLSQLGTEDRAAIRSAMEVTGVAHLASRTATELSGGERARVMLARALAVEAPVLIVDEPLASLDPQHQLETMDLLALLARSGLLVVAVLHDLGLAARCCDRLLVMEAGRLVADGVPSDVLTSTLLAEVFGVSAWFGEAGGLPLIVPTRPL